MASTVLEDVLSKIRPHTASNLAHQKKPAQLLVALESMVHSTSGYNSSSSPTLTPSVYFAALVTTLEGTLSRNETSLAEGDILPATLYLLAATIPFVPAALFRSHHSTLFSLI